MGFPRAVCLGVALGRAAQAMKLEATSQVEAAAEIQSQAAALAHLQARAEALRRTQDKPADAPFPELLDNSTTYKYGVGSGCGQKPSWDKEDNVVMKLMPAAAFHRAPTDKDAGWNGFCQMDWYACPDAVKNQDYYYYAKSLGPDWIESAGKIDVDYCGLNGWLKPEIARITHNFTALTEKAEELCTTKYSNPQFHGDKLTVFGGVAEALLTGLPQALQQVQGRMKEAMTTFSMDPMKRHISLFDKKAAGMAAAWNCALGSLGCDLAYCNYAYCELPDGSWGIGEQCPGWDKVKGMPAARVA